MCNLCVCVFDNAAFLQFSLYCNICYAFKVSANLKQCFAWSIGVDFCVVLIGTIARGIREFKNLRWQM